MEFSKEKKGEEEGGSLKVFGFQKDLQRPKKDNAKGRLES